jgi:hypothetical protein
MRMIFCKKGYHGTGRLKTCGTFTAPNLCEIEKEVFPVLLAARIPGLNDNTIYCIRKFVARNGGK